MNLVVSTHRVARSLPARGFVGRPVAFLARLGAVDDELAPRAFLEVAEHPLLLAAPAALP